MIRSLVKVSLRTLPFFVVPPVGMITRIQFDFAKISKKQEQKAQNKKQKQQAKQSVGGKISQIDLQKYEQAYEEVIKSFKNQLSTIRAGRLQVNTINKAQVKISSQTHTISELAQVSAKGANSCIVSPFDSSQIQLIQKALKIWDDSLDIKKQDNTLLLTQMAQGKQAKDKLIQKAKKISNDRKQQLKTLRSNTQEELRKYKKIIPQDRYRTIESQAKNIFDKKNQQIEKLQKQKEKQLAK